jgi:hypothetical protein
MGKPGQFQTPHQVLASHKPHLLTQFAPPRKLDIQHHAPEFALILTQPHEAIPRQIHPVAVMTP